LSILTLYLRRRKALIDGACCQAKRFQVETKPENYGPIQSEPRFRTVPGDELLHRELVFRRERAELKLFSTVLSPDPDRAAAKRSCGGVFSCSSCAY
jgi:hypothetical protein